MEYCRRLRGLISFGHAAFFGIGAYTSTILLLNFGVPPWFGMLAGALIAACAGALLTQVCARLRGPFFILSTLAAGEVVRIAALNWRSLTGGAEGLEIPPVPSVVDMVFKSQWPYVTIIVAYMLAMFALSVWIEQTRYGYYLFATRDDEDGASAIGINPSHTRTAAMARIRRDDRDRGNAFRSIFPLSRPDACHLARYFISVRSDLRGRRPWNGERASVRRADHCAVIGVATRLAVPINIRSSPRHLWHHRHYRHSVLPVRHFRRDWPRGVKVLSGGRICRPRTS